MEATCQANTQSGGQLTQRARSRQLGSSMLDHQPQNRSFREDDLQFPGYGPDIFLFQNTFVVAGADPDRYALGGKAPPPHLVVKGTQQWMAPCPK